MTTKSVLLLDFDNLFSGLWEVDRGLALDFAERPERWLAGLAAKGGRRWLIARCYLNPHGWVNEYPNREYFSRFALPFTQAGFDVINCPPLTGGAKNAADIRIVIDALDMLSAPAAYDEFVIASGDSDFAPLFRRIRAAGRAAALMSSFRIVAAYRSLADTVLDLDAIEELVWPDRRADGASDIEAETDSTDRNGGAAAPRPQARPHGLVLDFRPKQPEGPDWDAFSEYVRQEYESATAPLNLASLASRVRRDLAGAQEGRWYGLGTFLSALSRVALPNAATNQHHLWDTTRFEEPEGAAPPPPVDLPPLIEQVVRAVALPRIGSVYWPQVFAVLAEYAGMDGEFDLTEVTAWARDRLKERGSPVSRQAIAYVVRGVADTRARLDTSPPPSPELIGNEFYTSVLRNCASVGLAIDEALTAALGDWLGVAHASTADEGAPDRTPDRPLTEAEGGTAPRTVADEPAFGPDSDQSNQSTSSGSL
jgi:hypothetical protein